MAERDPARLVSDAVQPMRQAQQALDASVQVVSRTIADETGWADLWGQLSTLPSAATFAPLKSAQSLPVDIPPAAQQEAVQPEAARRPFVDALLQRARDEQSRTADSRPALSVVTGAGGLPALGRAESRATETQPSLSMPAPAPAPAPTKGQGDVAASAVVDQASAQAQISHPAAPSNASGVSLGSWGALESIAALVADLERRAEPSVQRAGKSSTDLPTRQEAPQAAGAPQPLPSARAPRAAADAVLPQPTAARTQESIATPPSGSSSSGGTSPSLDGLVQDWWSSSAEPAQQRAPRSQLPAASDSLPTLAPRSVSMLAPRVTPTTRAAALSAGSSVSANDSIAPGIPSAPGPLARGQGSEPRPQDDDALAEQLNRALVEQAWRGGVDLT